jgi:hypothetical protein
MLAVILLIFFAMLMVSAFFMPLANATNNIGSTKDFRWYCVFWSRNGYQGTEAKLDDSTTQPMESLCKTQLGISPLGTMSETDWQNCRNACRFKIS